ncbi:LuxR C-terminal-related transcriptional regulator [Mucilaginibacter sp. L3T2-6]|uniref:LuxR C-terminal-related transcriptional regulator n=1 Tax=Mucilaginibacter sp. L3T2-6 TaxID=3062491 RepID=UPI0026747D90|nr:LuxR C-terminal-related transcriptional regulator [Mucilaginibacter sp. L3T2-6]MDO3641427.1 LuxR C-terminal-related transcriptional regulator [Mucilaginibacter sp. L3T2-6]MDV6213812.1 LuxR C-terminal-related transcriptional regulator [Mucilaginibacter sp. L3T2-6]
MSKTLAIAKPICLAYLSYMASEHNETDSLITLRVLNQIGASILSEFTVEQIIDTVYQHVNRLMDAYSFAIGLYNPVSQRFEYTGTRENGKKMPAFSIYAHSTERFSGWVFANKKEVFINDFENEYQRYLPARITALHGLEPASLMYVPLMINQEIIGLLSVRTPVKNAYTQHSLEILKTLAVFISKAIENARARKNDEVAARQAPGDYHLNPLSARELDVLNLLSKGAANRAIADSLFISPSTVKTHTLNIYQKLGAANRTEAIIKARDYGLIN